MVNIYISKLNFVILHYKLTLAPFRLL